MRHRHVQLVSIPAVLPGLPPAAGRVAFPRPLRWVAGGTGGVFGMPIEQVFQYDGSGEPERNGNP